MRKILGVLLGCLMLAGCGAMTEEEAAAEQATGKSEAALSWWLPPAPTPCELSCKDSYERTHCIKKCLIGGLPRLEVSP